MAQRAVLFEGLQRGKKKVIAWWGSFLAYNLCVQAKVQRVNHLSFKPKNNQ